MAELMAERDRDAGEMRVARRDRSQAAEVADRLEQGVVVVTGCVPEHVPGRGAN